MTRELNQETSYLKYMVAQLQYLVMAVRMLCGARRMKSRIYWVAMVPVDFTPPNSYKSEVSRRPHN